MHRNHISNLSPHLFCPITILAFAKFHTWPEKQKRQHLPALPFTVGINVRYYSLVIKSKLRFTKAVSAAPDSMFCDSKAKSKA